MGLWSLTSDTPAREVSIVPCPFHALTSLPCPGCGMTRACVALAHAELFSAWQHHPFSFFLLGLAVCFAFFPVATRRTWRRLLPSVRAVLLSGVALSALGLWIHRLVTAGV